MKYYRDKNEDGTLEYAPLASEPRNGFVNKEVSLTQQKFLSETTNIGRLKKRYNVISIGVTEYLHKHLSNSEFVFVMRILIFTKLYSCLLVYGEKNKRVTREFLCIYLDMSKDMVSKILKSLVRKEVIWIKKRGHYFMNPFIFFLGKNIDKEVVRHFRETVWYKYYKNEYED